MTTENDFGWLVQDSPSLVLVLDEALLCCGIAQAWRSRLERDLTDSIAIPAARLFDLDGAPGLVDRLEAVVRDGTPISNGRVGLQLAEGTLACRFAAWRAQPARDRPTCVLVAASDVQRRWRRNGAAGGPPDPTSGHPRRGR